MNNILFLKYHFCDPCKYLIWKITVDDNVYEPTDILRWDVGGFRERDSDDMITTKTKNMITGTKIKFINKTRETWHDTQYFQTLQPYNKYVNPLDCGENFYSLALYPKLLQPSGTTNLTKISDIELCYAVNEQLVRLMERGHTIRTMTWTCTYNIFVTMSGFSALRFYGN